MTDEKADKKIYHIPENDRKFTALIVLTALLVTTYLTANIMAVKLITVFNLTLFDAGTITFPLAYMLGDVITEIYGFKMAKKLIWLTFFCNILLVASTSIGIVLPFPEYMSETQAAYSHIFTVVPRILAASLIAFVAGELLNAYFMVLIKKRTGEKHLWLRTIGSSVVGYLVDTVLFVLLAFSFTDVPPKDLVTMIIAQYLMKLLIESVCGTPLAYAVIAWIKGGKKKSL